MKINKLFQRLLWHSRLMILLAVVSGIIAAALMLLLGTTKIIYDVGMLPKLFTHMGQLERLDRSLVTHVISAIDLYLIATVLFIFSIGLYELFVAKLDQVENSQSQSKIFVIHNLDQLKEKLGKVIIMVLIVTYFKFAISMDYKAPFESLYLGAGILLVALAVYFSHGRKK